MTINKEINGSIGKFEIEGRLDTLTAPDLEKEVREVIDDLTDLTFDFKNLEYLSSAGIRVILGAHKVMLKQGSMQIINVNDDIKEIFRMIGFDDIMSIK